MVFYHVEVQLAKDYTAKILMCMCGHTCTTVYMYVYGDAVVVMVQVWIACNGEEFAWIY